MAPRRPAGEGRRIRRPQGGSGRHGELGPGRACQLGRTASRADVTDEIRAARSCGVVRCGVPARPSPTVAELAAEFGLAPDPASYGEIDAAAARRLCELVSSRDMAYDSELMPPARAAELAGRFMARFGDEGVRFYTNGSFHELPATGVGWPGPSWYPVTGATFDTGVLVVGHRCSGRLWVGDEY